MVRGKRLMKTLICPTCGCSLVRLGISKEKASISTYNGEKYYFCCHGCVTQFTVDPDKYLNEIKDMIVCPTCLAEKQREFAVKLKIAGREVYFCRCPHCHEGFRKDPDYYIRRLEGKVEEKN